MNIIIDAQIITCEDITFEGTVRAIQPCDACGHSIGLATLPNGREITIHIDGYDWREYECWGEDQ